MYYKTEGLVLRETEYKDADKLLTVLTKDRGQVTLRARGVRSKNSPLKSGCQLLAYSEFTVFEGRTATVNEAVPICLFLPLRENIEQLALASYFAQIAELLSQEDSPDSELLYLCLYALQALCEKKQPQKLLKAAFEFRAVCLAGYAPALDGCMECGNSAPDFFQVSAGTLICAGCRPEGHTGLRLPVHPGTLDAMRHVSQCRINRLFSFQLGEQSTKEFCGIAETYLLTQLEYSFFTLDFYKSLFI